jgi:hypothetical protein
MDLSNVAFHMETEEFEPLPGIQRARYEVGEDDQIQALILK